MHRPPAVSFQVGRSGWHAFVLSAGVLVTTISLCAFAWSAAAEFPWWAVWVQALLVLLTAMSAAWAWRRSPVGTLRWDGEQWFWIAKLEIPVPRLSIVFDFQRLILVSLSCKGLWPIFLWLEPAQATPPQSWVALRRALVHSSHNAALTPDQSAEPERQ
jgi:hypothetical protein